MENSVHKFVYEPTDKADQAKQKNNFKQFLQRRNKSFSATHRKQNFPTAN